METKLMDMPPSIKAFVKVTAEPEGDFATVVINARLSHEQQEKSCEHEESHLAEGDMDKACADDVEKEGHYVKKG